MTRANNDSSEWFEKIPLVAAAFVDFVPKKYRKRLDYSEKSITYLDKIVDEWHGPDGPSRENIETMIWAYGCYIAEILRRNYDGDWKKNDDGTCYFEGESAGVSPWNWMAKRFDSGPSEAIEAKYVLAQSLLSDCRKAAPLS